MTLTLRYFALALMVVAGGCVRVKVPSFGPLGHRSYYFAVSSPDDIKRLRSGHLCAALRGGGVRCLGPHTLSSAFTRESTRQKAFIWQDGYCVPLYGPRRYRNEQRIACEWFSHRSVGGDRQAVFRTLPGPVTFAAFPDGACACTDESPTRKNYEAAVCLTTRTTEPRISRLSVGVEEYQDADKLEVTEFMTLAEHTAETAPRIRICDLARTDPAALRRLLGLDPAPGA